MADATYVPPQAQRCAAKLRELPDAPGVYKMLSQRGKVLYVGKALSLKNRVPSYFTAAAEYDPRIAHLVPEIHDIDWVVVPSELDALVLESSLIRQLKPRYNAMLKDDKSYPYVKITVNEPYPRVMLTRRYLADKAKYWGPLTSVTQVRAAVKFIAGLFQLRTCKLELDGQKFMQKPCLLYHLKQCSAPCVDYISQAEYRKLAGYAVDFFNGRYGRVLDELKRRMAESAAAQQYENAARYRDLIGAVQTSFARSRVIGKPGEDCDIIGLARSQAQACILVMPLRDGRVLSDRKYILENRLEDNADAEVLSAFIKLHYANPQNIPPEIVLSAEPEDCELLTQWLGVLRASTLEVETVGPGRAPAAKRRKKAELDSGGAPPPDSADPSGEVADAARRVPTEPVCLTTRPHAVYKKELLAIAQRNAAERLHTHLLTGNGREDFVVTEGQRALAEHLHLPDFPRRIEGYDIANLQGKQATGAMTVFIGGRKAPREYRLFNIRVKDTPDDYLMLQETLLRRLTRLMTDARWDAEVDLIMIDGGKGQLGVARSVLSRLLLDDKWTPEQKAKLERISLCSLAKQEETIYFYAEQGVWEDGHVPGYSGAGERRSESGAEHDAAEPTHEAEEHGVPAAEAAHVTLEEPWALADAPGHEATDAPSSTRHHNTGGSHIVELKLPHTDPGLRLLVGLRDEAHRYGNSQHARLRDKAMKLSVLETVPGVGPARMQALLKHFGSVKQLRAAGVDELAAVAGIGPKLAEQLQRYLERDAALEDGKADMVRELKIRRIKRQNEVER
jgi:excinuclease ABC subunit C